MGTYNFQTDLKVANITEQEVGAILESRGNQVVGFNNDYRYDIELRTKSGTILLEVKEDFMAVKTGNIAIEFESRGKPSGIVRTHADFYVFKLTSQNEQLSEFYTAPVNTIKNAIISCLYERIVVGGDKGSGTKMYLFTLANFIPITTRLS